MGVEIVPHTMDTTMVDQNEPIKPRTMDIHAAYHIFGYFSQAITIVTVRHYGWELTGKWNKCLECAMAKIRPTEFE